MLNQDFRMQQHGLSLVFQPLSISGVFDAAQIHATL